MPYVLLLDTEKSTFIVLSMSVGTLIAMLFIQANDIEEMHAQLAVFMNEFEISVPQLPDLDLSRVREEWSRLRNNIPEVWKFNRDGREFQVGEMMKARDLSAEYPLVLVPGIVSTVGCLNSAIRNILNSDASFLRRDWNHGQRPPIIALSFARNYGVASTWYRK